MVNYFIWQSPPKGATIPYRPKPQVGGPVILAGGQAYTIQGNYAVPATPDVSTSSSAAESLISSPSPSSASPLGPMSIPMGGLSMTHNFPPTTCPTSIISQSIMAPCTSSLTYAPSPGYPTLVPLLSNHPTSSPMFTVSPMGSMSTAGSIPKNGTISLAAVSVPLSFYLGGGGAPVGPPPPPSAVTPTAHASATASLTTLHSAPVLDVSLIAGPRSCS